MSFSIEGKIALISGGASGIGLSYAKELLKNNLKGVTLADINENFGEKALKEIQNEFGPNKAIYVKTDVTNKYNYEEAFKKTIGVFKNLDIVINNAGILNDSIWEKCLLVNINGTINGTLLALENYIPKFKTDSEGVIVNVSSIAGLTASGIVPIYSCTKFAIIGLSKAFGEEEHYNRTKVRVVTLCPGITDTAMMAEISGKNLGPPYQDLLEKRIIRASRFSQTPEHVASAMIRIIKYSKTASVWVVEDGEEPYEYVHPPKENFKP